MHIIDTSASRIIIPINGGTCSYSSILILKSVHLNKLDSIVPAGLIWHREEVPCLQGMHNNDGCVVPSDFKK
jgi:hypothetical protein